MNKTSTAAKGKGVVMSMNTAEAFELLFDKDNKTAYKALQELQKESEETDHVYPYMDRLSDMLESDNSYIRTRGLTLLAYNARWDRDNKIDEIIDGYLKHITDVKPVTARQCIKLLPMLAKDKPELKEDILSALHRADVSFYEDSMRPLVYKDIQKALKEIQKLLADMDWFFSGRLSYPAGNRKSKDKNATRIFGCARAGR